MEEDFCFGGLIMLQVAPIWGSHFPICELSFVKSVRICQIQYYPWAECTFSASFLALQTRVMDNGQQWTGAKSTPCKKKVGILSQNSFIFLKPEVQSNPIKGQRISCFIHIDFVHVIIRSCDLCIIYQYFASPLWLPVADTRYHIVLISWEIYHKCCQTGHICDMWFRSYW